MFFAGRDYLDVDAIFEWFQLCAASVEAHRVAFMAWFDAGQAGPPPSPLPVVLLGATGAEVTDHFEATLKELELSAVMWLVTACEGRLRIDLRKRLSDSDLLAGRLRAACAARSQEFLVPLEDDGILDAWKTFIRSQVADPLQNQAIQAMGQVKPLIDARHWLAHGRYWQTKIDVATLTPAAVRKTIVKFFASLDQVTSSASLRALP